MRILLCLIFIFSSLAGKSQLWLEPNEPSAVDTYRQILYWGIDNPISINTGRLGKVKITVRNAILKKSTSAGTVLVQPNGKGYDSVVLVLTNGKWKKAFSFSISYLAMAPEIGVL